MGKWTHKNNIVYDEDGEAFADCRFQRGRAAQIVREHNAHDDLVDMVGKYRENRVEMRGMCPGGESLWAGLRQKYQEEIDRIDAVLATAAIAKAKGESHA